VTEVGRQPWVVYNILRTADAVTQAGTVRAFAVVVVVVYVIIAATTVLTLRVMSRRWTAGEAQEPLIPYGPVDAVSPEAEPPLVATGGSGRDT
jgi:cytochrome d ubiquinol oxidase subunit I